MTTGDSFEARRATVDAAGAGRAAAGDDEGPFGGIEPFAAERFARRPSIFGGDSQDLARGTRASAGLSVRPFSMSIVTPSAVSS